MARCRGCDAEIDFVRLYSGRMMPVDGLEADEYRVWSSLSQAVSANTGPEYQAHALVLVQADGNVQTFYQVFAYEGDRVRTVPGPMLVWGRESHFASCPKSQEFRR